MTDLRVAFGGPKQAGKSTMIRQVRQYLGLKHGVIVAAWADPIREIAQQLFGLSWHDLIGLDHDRESPHPKLGGNSIRALLQELGTELARKYDPDVWVRKMGEHLTEEQALLFPNSFVWCLIDGTRFPNELIECDISVWIQGREETGDTHASENSLGPDDFDYVVRNDGPKEDIPLLAATLCRELEMCRLGRRTVDLDTIKTAPACP